jgi:predicted nucleotidyltransferase
MDAVSPPLAAEVLSTLRAHQPVLRQAGISHLSLFGSVARNEAGAGSDIDLVAEFDPAAQISLLDLVRLERELGELLGRRVDILPEPIRKERLRNNIARDRIRAF